MCNLKMGSLRWRLPRNSSKVLQTLCSATPIEDIAAMAGLALGSRTLTYTPAPRSPTRGLAIFIARYSWYLKKIVAVPGTRVAATKCLAEVGALERGSQAVAPPPDGGATDAVAGVAACKQEGGSTFHGLPEKRYLAQITLPKWGHCQGTDILI